MVRWSRCLLFVDRSTAEAIAISLWRRLSVRSSRLSPLSGGGQGSARFDRCRKVCMAQPLKPDPHSAERDLETADRRISANSAPEFNLFSTKHYWRFLLSRL